MAKRTYQRVSSAIEGWDALINDNYTQMESQPFPLARYASFAGLPAASSNDEAIALYADTGATDEKVAMSNGVSWFRVPLMAAAVVSLTDTTGGTANDTLVAISGSGADANINNNFADLAAKINALLAALRVSRALTT